MRLPFWQQSQFQNVFSVALTVVGAYDEHHVLPLFSQLFPQVTDVVSCIWDRKFPLEAYTTVQTRYVLGRGADGALFDYSVGSRSGGTVGD